MLSPQKYPLRIANVAYQEEEKDIDFEGIKVENLVENKVVPKSINCSDCGKTFEAGYFLRRHIQRVHGDKESVCELCDAKFTRNDNLHVHINKFHLRELLVCSFCPFKAKEETSVMEHAKKVHPLNDLSKMTFDKVFEKIQSPKKDPLRIETRNGNCPTCGKYCRKGLSKHIRKTHGEYRWQCEQCDATFSDRGNLQRHLKVIHVGELFQ